MIQIKQYIRYHESMSSQINIHFQHELNDFLSADQCDSVLYRQLKELRSVKDLIESIGVPHTEVDLIIVNDKSVDFGYLVSPNDSIQVYPAATTTPAALESISPLIHCQPEPPAVMRFVLDVHLGRLTAYMRMLGFDSLYHNDCDDPTLADISANEQRILLTCDRQLLMRKQVSHGYFVRSRQPRQQLLEVITRFDLFDSQKPFTRCMHCNGITRQVDKQEIDSHLLADTRKYYDEFFQCTSCNKIYWKGSHYLKMQKLINRLNSGTG